MQYGCILTDYVVLDGLVGICFTSAFDMHSGYTLLFMSKDMVSFLFFWLGGGSRGYATVHSIMMMLLLL